MELKQEQSSIRKVIQQKQDFIGQIKNGIQDYLNNRNTSLSWIVSKLDSARGCNRANCYLTILNHQSISYRYKLLTIYTLLEKSGGTQLKEHVKKSLGCRTIDAAKELILTHLNNSKIDVSSYLIQKLVEKINECAEANDINKAKEAIVVLSQHSSSTPKLRENISIDNFKKFIFPKLNLQDMNAFVRTCKYTNSLFTSFLTPEKLMHYLAYDRQDEADKIVAGNPSLETTKFLHHVAFGQQEAAKNMLIKDPDLLYRYGKICDYSRRFYPHITAFQYALWALDNDMWRMIVACYRIDNNDNVAYLKELQRQYTELNQNGVTYYLNGVKHQERHYDFASLTLPIQIFISKCNSNSGKSWHNKEAGCRYTIEKIGHAQRLVPAHVAQHCCNRTKPWTIKTFKQPVTRSFFVKGSIPCMIDFAPQKSHWFPLPLSPGLGQSTVYIASERYHLTSLDKERGKRAQDTYWISLFPGNNYTDCFKPFLKICTGLHTLRTQEFEALGQWFNTAVPENKEIVQDNPVMGHS